MPTLNGEEQEFVEGWYIMQTLGEGAYGEVKLVLNKATREVVAMKVINLLQFPGADETVRKEILIHRKLQHPHVITFFGHRKEANIEYIFLEYAPGGELFDRIEPDYGMSLCMAQKYFRQLLKGVDYLHGLGIAHRDLKPENLLLDDNVAIFVHFDEILEICNNLKISDFGMATLFRNNGKERWLDVRCGTMPYVAPEMLADRYLGEPADIWSCGVILVVLLSGELPWNVASTDNKEYADWNNFIITKSPWNKISTLDLSFLRKILNPDYAQRIKLKEMRSHRWVTENKQPELDVAQTSGSRPEKRINLGLNTSLSKDEDSSLRISHSQPEGACALNNEDIPFITPISFSQSDQIQLLTTSQANGNSQSQTTVLQKLVKRMTRFFVTTNVAETVAKLEEVSKTFNYGFRINSIGLVTFSTRDRRDVQLIFKASILEMQEKMLVDFRLSKGDGLEFKRHFQKIRDRLERIIQENPVSKD
uniref:non-specific serine/threonine protein kinase n=1 Tax=Strigamia maritima TaxID=126957 RepID=T1IL17_STRMM